MGKAVHPLLGRIGERIRRLRQEQEISQEALADAASLDRSFMSQIERGQRNVTVLKLLSVARALGVPMRDLLDRD